MKHVSLIFAYYDNGEMLARQLSEWQSYDPNEREALEFVIVDDGSPNKPAIDYVKGCDFDLQLFRIGVNIPWNQDGARNLAMRHARGRWALMMDMDHMLPRDQVKPMLDFVQNQARMGTYYMPNQHLTNGVSLDKPHPNGYLFNNVDFHFIGGYDEDFAGYYGSDGHFRRTAKYLGLIEKPTMSFHTVVFRAQDIEDANTKDWARKESAYHSKNCRRLVRKMRGEPTRPTNSIRFPFERLL